MGVDLDFKHHMSKLKLTASQYEQPVNELDENTESTEQSQLQNLLEILALVQGRLRQRFDETDQFVSLMIQMNEDRRFLITFMGRPPQQPERNNILRNIPRMDIRRNDRQMRRRDRQRQVFEPRPRQINIQRPRQRENREQPIWPQNQINNIARQDELNFSQTNTSQQSHQFAINQPNLLDDQQLASPLIPQIFPQIRNDPFQSQIQQIPEVHVQIEDRRIENQQPQGENNETTNQIHLNQISVNPIKAKIKPRQEQVDEPVTCWRFLTRIISNFFKKFR